MFGGEIWLHDVIAPTVVEMDALHKRDHHLAWKYCWQTQQQRWTPKRWRNKSDFTTRSIQRCLLTITLPHDAPWWEILQWNAALKHTHTLITSHHYEYFGLFQTNTRTTQACTRSLVGFIRCWFFQLPKIPGQTAKIELKCWKNQTPIQADCGIKTPETPCLCSKLGKSQATA